MIFPTLINVINNLRRSHYYDSTSGVTQNVKARYRSKIVNFLNTKLHLAEHVVTSP